MSILIGISGKKMSGKDALCNSIRKVTVKFSTQRIAFADALKEEVAQACGVSVQFIEDNKSQFRPILQWWGTDFRRKYQGDDYWVKRALGKINEAYDKGVNLVIVPDVRFKSEAETIKSVGGYLVRIARPTQLIDGHISETELDDYKGFDYVVINNGTLDDLDREAGLIYSKI